MSKFFYVKLPDYWIFNHVINNETFYLNQNEENEYFVLRNIKKNTISKEKKKKQFTKIETSTTWEDIPIICEQRDFKLYDIITNKEFGLSGIPTKNFLFLNTSIEVSEKDVLETIKSLNKEDIKRYRSSMNIFVETIKNALYNKDIAIKETDELESQLKRIRRIK